MKHLTIDIWADGPRAAVRPRRGEMSIQAHFDRVDALGVQAVSIFCSRANRQSPEGIQWLWRDLEALRRLVEMHRAAGRRVTLTEWVGASAHEVALHLHRLEKLCQAGIWPDRLEHDAEEDVTNDSAQEASAAPQLLEAGYQRLEQKYALAMPEVVVTGIPGAPGDVRRYGAWRRARVWRGQWYSFYRPPSMGAHWTHKADARGPIDMQDWGAQVARRLVELGLFERFEAGLAWYFQRHLPGYDGDVEEALYDAAWAAAQHTQELCGWSLRHLYKPGREARTTLRFVQKLAAGLFELGSPAADEPMSQALLVERLQWLLASRGADLGHYGPGRDGVDGHWGDLTAQAAQVAEEQLGLQIDGRPDLELLRVLTQEYHQVMGQAPNYKQSPLADMKAA